VGVQRRRDRADLHSSRRAQVQRRHPVERHALPVLAPAQHQPTTAGEYAAITDEIKGAPEWRTGADVDGNPVCQTDEEKAACEEVVKGSVAALDMAGAPCTDYEQADCRVLKLTFSKPAPYFHTIMGIWVSYPAKQELIEEGGETWWLSSKFQIGNGTFILKTMEPYVRGYFTPNPNYWGGEAKVDIEYSYITDSAVSFQAYKNDEFDIIAWRPRTWPPCRPIRSCPRKPTSTPAPAPSPSCSTN